jgi:hypothetical protein
MASIDKAYSQLDMRTIHNREVYITLPCRR